MKKISKFVVSALVLMVGISFSEAAASAAEEPFFGRPYESTKIYREASASSAVKQQVHEPQDLLVLGSFKNRQGELWYNVRSFTDTGWMKADMLKPYGINSKEVKSMPGKTSVVRRSAEASATVKGDLTGAETAFISDSIVNKQGEKWVRVSNPLTKSTQTGWVKLSDVTFGFGEDVKTHIMYKDAKYPARVFSDGSFKKEIDTIAYGSEIYILSVYDLADAEYPRILIAYGKDFTKIGWTDYGVTHHYYRDLLNKNYSVTGNTVIHSSASDKSAVTASLKKGQTVKAIDIYQTWSPPAQYWLRVTAPNGINGWMKSPGSFLNINGLN